MNKPCCNRLLGVGTTAVACAMEGRKCIGIEIDEGYYDISKKRITDAVANKSLFEPSEMEEKIQEETLF